jgi:hypothetical protein
MTSTRELLELSSDDCFSYEVAEHSDEEKTNAACRAMDRAGADYEKAPKALAWLVSRAKGITLRPHEGEPEPDEGGYNDCGCEDSSWWCTEASGEPRHFYEFDVHDVIDEAWRMAIEEEHADDDEDES